MGKSVSRCITVTTVIDGENGANGYNTAVVQLFRRYTPTQEAPTPALPTGTLTYTFSTGKLTGSASYFNGWSQNMPSAASGEKLFVTMATARSQEATDSIAANEWSAPVEYVADGANGEPGISQAPVIIYKRSASQPTDKPANNAKYYFKTVGSTKAGSLVGTLNGWSTVIPANTNGLPCWTRQATAVAPATADYDEIAASEWSDPATKLVDDGDNAKYIYVRGTGWNHDAERILNVTSSDNLFSSHQQRGLVVARINRNTLAASDITWFDVYGGTSEGGESAENANLARTKFITYLTNTTADYFLAIASRDAVGFNDAMVAKLREFGLGKLDYTAVSGVGGFRTPFAFLGYRGLQQGYALYQLQGTEATDPYAEAMAYIANGVFMSAKDGEDGANGYNTATVSLYQRYAPTTQTPTPAKPSGTLTYTFATGVLSGTMGNWSQTIPAAVEGTKLFVTQAVARSQEATDSIAPTEWSTPVEYVADGTSPYFADIDNEMDSVVCDKDGKTTAAYDAYINVHVWHGSTEETLTTLTTNSITGFTITPDASNKRIRVQVASGTQIAPVNTINITAASADSGNKSLHFVLNGVRAGANGEPAVIYALVPSVSSVVKKKDGSYSVSGVSCTRQKNVGGTITNNTTDGTITCRIDGGNEMSYTNNDEIPVSSFTKSVQFIFKVGGVTVDTETILMIADGEDSTVPGPAAVMYSISLAGSVLANDPNTGKLIVSIVGRVYKTEGDTTTPYTALTKSNLYLYFEKADGSGSQVPAGDISVSDNQFTTTYQNGANYSNEVLLGVRFNIDNVIKARESIQVVKYGTNGQSITGHTGRFFYYAGDYSGVPGNYAMQETQGPYVKVTNGANIEFWMLDFKGVEPASFPATATEAPSDQSTQWTKMSSEQKYYIARAFFGPYAHFGSFIINSDWMISQYGVLVDSSGTKTIVNAYNVDTLFNGKVPYAWFDPTDPTANTAPLSGQYKFAPNFAVDGLAGKTYQNDAYIRGEVHATSGEFTGKVTAQSGNIGGFEIGTDRLYNTNWNAGVDIDPNDGRNVKIGKNAQGVIGTESAIIRAENTRPNQTYNTALYLNAQNGTYNYAFYGNGNGVLNGLMFGYKVQLHTIPSGNTDAISYLNIKSGSTIILNGSHSNGNVWIAAPKLSDVRKCLGINSTTTPFAIEFTVVSHANYEYVSIGFRNAITETRDSEYPWLMNTDDGHIVEPFGSPSIQIAQGDVVKILLLYDNVGTTSSPNYEYRAYDLIRRV